MSAEISPFETACEISEVSILNRPGRFLLLPLLERITRTIAGAVLTNQDLSSDIDKLSLPKNA